MQYYSITKPLNKKSAGWHHIEETTTNHTQIHRFTDSLFHNTCSENARDDYSSYIVVSAVKKLPAAPHGGNGPIWLGADGQRQARRRRKERDREPVVD